jgi:transcriptional regulator with XRE-family HTH domain
MGYTKNTRVDLGDSFSEGARRLWGVIGDGSRSEFARRVGVSRSDIHRLLYGDSVPELETAVALERETGIAPRFWLQSPRRQFVLPACRKPGPPPRAA